MLFFNPFTPKSDLIDFTLSYARRFYSSKRDPLGVKELILLFVATLIYNPWVSYFLALLKMLRENKRFVNGQDKYLLMLASILHDEMNISIPKPPV